MDNTLFPVGPSQNPSQPLAPALSPRVDRPVRNQVEIIYSDLDNLLPLEHQARTVWAYVENLNLADLYAAIKATEGRAGRTPIDPRILLALWLYATLDGEGSSRGVAKLCTESIPYLWMCGGVSVNYHTLSDFRGESEGLLDELLTDSVAMLRAKNLVTLNRVAHDGLRVRANAGGSSFHRLDTLDRCLLEAQEQVQALRRELDQQPGASDQRRKSARERAAREQQERVAEALKQYPDVKKKKKDNKEHARVSTTDPDARRMHMPDGGTRPAYNVQFSTDTASQVIVGVDVIQSGSDSGQLESAVKQVRERHGVMPSEFLIDGGFVKQEAIENLANGHEPCTIYAPVPRPKKVGGKVFAHETPQVSAWMKRMETAEAKVIYKERASTAECVNAQARNRGMQQFRVRGLRKVRAVTLMFALAHNLMRSQRLLKSAA